MLNELGKEAHDNAVAHGFYEAVPECLCFIQSEVSEAFEAYRDGKMQLETADDGKPIGFPSELADIILVVVDLAYFRGIDLDAVVRAKMTYNSTRPFKNGRKGL